MTQLSEIADEVGKIGAAWGEFRERWDSRADQMDGIERRLNRLDLNNLFSAGIPVDAKFSRYGDARLKDDGYPSAFGEYLRRPLSGLTITNDKPPALLEDSQCFTYAEDLPECFDRSKHFTQETFHDDCHE